MTFARVVLDGDWQLTYFPEGEYRPAGPADLAQLGAPCVPATVPGNVELDLQAAGVLPEPFYADNIRRLRPYEFYEWWYTRDFDVPAALPAGATGWDLVFAGLDTLATVWVNGVEVGRSADMLIEQRFDVTAALRPGQTNQIAVRLASALNYAAGFHYDAAGMSWEGREETLYVRKPAHAYGWDIMPRAVSAGIWRPVWLEPRPADAITQLYFWTAGVDARGATLGVRYQFRSAGGLDGLALRFHGVCTTGGTEHTFDFEWPVEFVAGGCRIPVAGARLWWPHGYGAPNLYTVTVQLCRRGEVLAERTERIGIRKLVVDRTETAGQAWFPEPGGDSPHRVDAAADPVSHFVIFVNDQPIMVKGANWVPLDAFHSRDASRVDRAVGLFADLGCNMIRCWGGNVYEDHRFFDLCDENGIMVWQDMSFACCRYPQDEAFLAQVRAETRAVAEKLRNHPSLAIWCGDNEIDGAYLSDGLSPQRNRLTREVIPQTLAAADPYRAYVPSSPYVPPQLEADPAKAASFWQHTPEQHLWGPRGYFKSPFYLQHSAHFIGEIGYHGCPNVSSIRRFISPEQLWPWQDNDEWQVHSVYHWQTRAVNRDRIELMANQVRELFGAIPDDLVSFALASQITQAEAKKFFIESTRLRKWRTSGILWWNVIDGWPQFSDAIVDYYFGRKLAYHYIRRAQQPVAVIIGEPGAGLHLPVVICNDTLADANVRYRVTDADTGATVAESEQVVPANQNWQVARIRTFAGDQRLYLMQWKVGGQLYGGHYLAGRPPFAFDRYRGWLAAIAALPQPFDAAAVGK
jgi:beta-mannosidase